MDHSTYSYHDGNEGLTFQPMVLKCTDEGVVFVGFVSHSSSGEPTVAIGEIYETYNVWWSWGYGCVVAY